MENSEKLTDRQLVTAYLRTLEFDEFDTAFELEQCSINPEARRYWLQRASGELV